MSLFTLLYDKYIACGPFDSIYNSKKTSKDIVTEMTLIIEQIVNENIVYLFHDEVATWANIFLGRTNTFYQKCILCPRKI